jgi:protocatechuate 3,4-dioxygenase beta subunit
LTPELNRRQAIATLGSVSLGALLAACGEDGGDGSRRVATTDGGTTAVKPRSASRATAELFDEAASCSVTPQETEGPYYFDADSIRRDIREDRKGTTLRLALRARDAKTCKPIENAVIDIWHCDALGIYSGFEAASKGSGGGGAPGSGRTDDEKYLRGAQVTNDDGIVEFVTIYPGWYRGRTVHIHAKVHLDSRRALTTQLFFKDEITAGVYDHEPYRRHTGRDLFNADDGLFDERLLLTLSREGDVYLGVMTFDVEAT